MKRVRVVCSGLMISFAGATALHAQESSAPQDVRPLVLTEAIPLENIKGRFDHFGTSGRKLFVSALGNNTVEVIDISGRTLDHTITGVPNPQGVVYAAEVNKLFVASSKGKLYIYDGTSFDLVTAIDFHGDVDNLRFDAATKRVYVGYGDDETAAIGAVDATTNKRTDEEYKLGAHPESFQLESAGPNIYVNLPDLKQIAVINRSTHAIARWPLTLEHNFPMALDEAHHRLFVGCRMPARLAVFDTETGKIVASPAIVEHTDDLFFDASKGRIYILGEGFIEAWQGKDPDHYDRIGRYPTPADGRTGLFVPDLGELFETIPHHGQQGAEILVYGTK